MRWFISDTHFNHEKVICYDMRPFRSAEEMESAIVKNWNNVVSKKDIVYHLGDFGFGSPKRFSCLVKMLNGNITLIRGNHDIKNGYTAKRCVDEFGCPLFSDIADIGVIHISGERFVLSHYPYTEERFPQMCPRDCGDWLIHGHSHKFHPRVHEKMINVGCCVWDYRPVSEEEIYKISRGRS